MYIFLVSILYKCYSWWKHQRFSTLFTSVWLLRLNSFCLNLSWFRIWREFPSCKANEYQHCHLESSYETGHTGSLH